MERKKGRARRRGPIIAAGALAACLMCWMLLNLIVDPFGVFGDRILGRWSYDMTNNARTAKFSYLEQHHGEFDSYVLGGPAAGAWPTQALDAYFDARFYNLSLRTMDMGDMERFARWLVEHYEVKNLLLTVTVENGGASAGEDRAVTEAMPYQLDGSSPLAYYARYLFANAGHSFRKLNWMGEDSVVPGPQDWYDPATGAIDYSGEDVEAIGAGDLEDYLALHPEFTDLPAPWTQQWQRECIASIAAIRDLCEQAGVNLVVAAVPLYGDYLARYPQMEVEDFFTALGRVTPYWDFTSSSVSQDPRYFYTPSCFRTAVGEMMLARMFDDSSVYCPEEFGVYRTADSGRASLTQAAALKEGRSYTARVPILMYHHLSETTVSGDRLDEHLAALTEAGYTSVTMADLRAYVEKGIELPDRPVVITFDDGYASNLEIGLPILEKYQMKATIYVIGCSVGKDTYKDTGQAMTPHFTAEQARALEDTGLVTIGSHGYDIHEVEGRDPDPIRHGVLQREGESEKDYIAFLQGDCARFQEVVEPALGRKVDILAYPYGQCSPLSEILLAREGFYATVTTIPGVNTLVKGLPQTLRAMDRFDIEAMDLTGEELLELLEKD